MSTKYTVVQHSGYGYAGNPQFQMALEERSLNKRQEKTVIDAGGVVLPGYVEASDLAERWNYPKAKMGLIPDCSSLGTFSRKKVDGLAIFVPTEEARRHAQG